MKRTLSILGMAVSILAAFLFFSGSTNWGVIILIAAYANLKIVQRLRP